MYGSMDTKEKRFSIKLPMYFMLPKQQKIILIELGIKKRKENIDLHCQIKTIY